MQSNPPQRPFFQRWWEGPSGYREMLLLAWPLILSTSVSTVQQTINRMFLGEYSPNAMAAAMPSSLASFVIQSFFLGVALYVNTFVAQYEGAKRYDRIGPSVWQGAYFSILAAIVAAAFIPFAHPIFQWFGHTPEVMAQEIPYFQILSLASGFSVFAAAISCFFTGRGKTQTVLWVSLGIAALNVGLDYSWIFGHFGFPEWGIRGAGWATVVSSATGCIVYMALFLSRKNNREFNTLRGWKFESDLFGRMMRYGLPNGVQFFLDILAFTLFIAFIGRLGTRELWASSTAFQINMIAFMPMIGFGTATATLVGQSLGDNKPDLGARATWSAFHLTFIYMTSIAVLYVVMPRIFILLFAAKANLAELEPSIKMACIILRFVAAYCMFDTMNVIFASSLRGAGDTRFVMITAVALGWAIMVIPTWIAIDRHWGGIYAPWMFLTIYVIIVGFCFLTRFIKGKWRSMRVIESAPHPHPLHMPEVPCPETEV